MRRCSSASAIAVNRIGGNSATQFYGAAGNTASGKIVGGTQDNGTQRWTGSATWEHIADGDGGDCGVNRGNPRTVFTTWNSWGSQLRPWRSTTGGDFGSWTFIPPPVPAGENSPFYPPFETSATGGDTIAIGGGAVYVSRNNGTNWSNNGGCGCGCDNNCGCC